mmetsp:Transcript_22190/g.43630  ORF Transcript_22190/g.43630 Transcript_22190/m.43630 type:complete len:584 (-) Transcript_22190:346-2097(-)
MSGEDGAVAQGWLESRACYLACALTSGMVGLMYAFPMFTSKFQDAGFDRSQIILAGVCIQLGFGLVSFPFGHFYSSSFLNLSTVGMDRAITALSSSIIAGGLLLMIVILSSMQDESGSTSTGSSSNWSGPGISGGDALTFAFTVWGSGLGLSQYHSLSIVNFIFASDRSQRRMGVASMGFSAALGAVFYTLLYHNFFDEFSLTANIGLLLAAYIVLAAFRIKYMVRGRFEAVPVLDLPSILPSDSSRSSTYPQGEYLDQSEPPTIAAPEISDTDGRLRDMATGSDGIHSSTDVSEEQGPDSAPSLSSANPDLSSRNHLNGSQDASGLDTSVYSGISTHPPGPTIQDYIFNRIVWLTFISTMFGFGVGVTFLNSIGTLAYTLVEDKDDAEVDTVIFRCTLAFLSMVVFSRLVVTFVYAQLNWAYVIAIWNVFLFTGVIMYVAKPSLGNAYLSASLVGFGYGGLCSSPTVLVTSNFPGHVSSYSMNLALTATVMRVGPFLVGYLETIIYETSVLSELNDADMSSFFYFACGSMISTVSSLLLGREIAKETASERLQQRQTVELQQTRTSLQQIPHSSTPLPMHVA